MNRRGTTAGFTLIELLVVIAITTVLIGLILGPVIQTFNLTRRANAMVMSQDTARMTLEMVSRELGEAMFIYDNSNSPIVFPCENPNDTTPALAACPQGLYGKVDLILPKLVMHCNNLRHPEGRPRDYDRGEEAWPICPECLAAGIPVGPEDVEAKPKQPLTPDNKIVRYFVGLANNDPGASVIIYPSPGYRDWPESGAPINGFILYRAEFDPYNENLIPRVNGKPYLDDPYFFYSTDPAPDGNPRWQNWKIVAKPVGPQTDIDLITVKLDETETLIDGVTPSVRLQLTQVTNDSLSPAYTSDSSSESPLAIPTVFRAKYGGWGSAHLGDPAKPVPPNYSVSLIRYNEATGTNDIWYKTRWEWNSGLVDFDLWLDRYDAAGSRTGTILNISQLLQDLENPTLAGMGTTFTPPKPEVAFIVDPTRGEVRFDFPGSDVISQDDIAAMNANVRANWAGGMIGPSRAYRLSMFTNLDPRSGYQPRIVPGSEVVRGPDMTPGLFHDPSLVRLVRYERVPFNLGDPGRNQYKIDYGVDDLTGERVGWMIFSPAPDEPIPEMIVDGPARIYVSYKFQLNRDGDVVVANYTTKTLMTVTMGIRFYDRNSGKVHPVELTNKVRVRNLLR